jgi:hypothetical protein
MLPRIVSKFTIGVEYQDQGDLVNDIYKYMLRRKMLTTSVRQAISCFHVSNFGVAVGITTSKVVRHISRVLRPKVQEWRRNVSRIVGLEGFKEATHGSVHNSCGVLDSAICRALPAGLSTQYN